MVFFYSLQMKDLSGVGAGILTQKGLFSGLILVTFEVLCAKCTWRVKMPSDFKKINTSVSMLLR